MTGWERNAKRFAKALIWAAFVFLNGWFLEIEINLRVLALLIGAGLVSAFLDTVWPTAVEDGQSATH